VELFSKFFTRITDPNGSPIRKYFDGTKPRGSLNFLNPKNSVALEGLVHGLTTWFGAALGCSDDTIPPYGGPPLSVVHKVMKINMDEFNFFQHPSSVSSLNQRSSKKRPSNYLRSP